MQTITPPGLLHDDCVLFLEHATLFDGGERGGLVVNASDSKSRGWGFEPHSGQTVLCS